MAGEGTRDHRARTRAVEPTTAPRDVGRRPYARRVPGTLIVCAGPIGNLGDAPPRLAEALAAADVVYAEDTRRTRALLTHLGVPSRPLRSFFAGNEADRSAELAERLDGGETVAVITDAGVPGIADPGLTAVRAAVSVEATVTGIPGPSAVTLALALAGLPAERFVFEGFLPRRGLQRGERLQALADEPRTAVVFCAPGRLAADLADLADAVDRRRGVVVCREMTKLHEEVWRGSLGEAAAHWSGREVRGEVTVVLEGAGPATPDMKSAVEEAERLVEEGLPTNRASRLVAGETGVSRRELYEALVRRRARRAGATSDPKD